MVVVVVVVLVVVVVVCVRVHGSLFPATSCLLLSLLISAAPVTLHLFAIRGNNHLFICVKHRYRVFLMYNENYFFHYY